MCVVTYPPYLAQSNGHGKINFRLPDGSTVQIHPVDGETLNACLERSLGWIKGHGRFFDVRNEDGQIIGPKVASEWLIFEDIKRFVNLSIMTENKLNEPRCK